MKVTLTFVKRTERTSAKGKPYTSLSIKTIEHGEKFLSGFGSKDNAYWKEGEKVEITVNEVLKDGKTYLNFETPKKEPAGAADTQQILNAITGLKLDINNLGLLLKQAMRGPAPDDYPVRDPIMPFEDEVPDLTEADL